MTEGQGDAVDRPADGADSPAGGEAPPTPASRGRVRRVLLRLALALLALVVAAAVALAVAVFAFPYDPRALAPDAGGPLVVTDRRGEVLRRVPSTTGRPGRGVWLPLGSVPRHVVDTLVAGEDERFYAHVGVDPLGIARALWLDLRAGRLAYGGSTLTMQLMRMVHSAGAPRTLGNKLREAILALRAERVLPKDAILEQYLNRAYFGGGAYGLDAAARTYFDKPAGSLSPGEATLLAVLPRSPSAYELRRHLDRAVRRRDHVLALRVARGELGAEEADRIRGEPVRLHERAPEFDAPHFVDWVLASLPDDVRTRGGVVRATLDLRLQRALEAAVASHVRGHRRFGLDEAGVVVLDTRTGEVLAMVGSPDFAEAQLNITTWRRSPGSALKPFVYALALEDGDTPSTIAWDVVDVPSAYHPPADHVPRERGPARYREALAGSYNLAAVHVLEKVGVERLVARLRAAGVGEVPQAPEVYGPGLALGATRVRLVDLAAGYGAFVRGGTVVEPTALLRVEAPGGAILEPPRPPARAVFSPEVAWLIQDILADPEARRPGFGLELPMDDLPFPIALKTGTAAGFADTVAVGVTAEFTVAAWAGRFDGQPMQGLLAMTSAAPLVRTAFFLVADGRRLTLPTPPPGLVRLPVCPLSGRPPGPDCPHRKAEWFAPGTAPTERCPWHRRVGERLTVEWPPELAGWLERSGVAGR